MGTRFELVLDGQDATRLRAAGEEAIEAIEDAHRRLSRFKRGSIISEINAAAGSDPVYVDDELLDLLGRCERYRVQTGGAFDIVFRAAGGAGEAGSEPICTNRRPILDIDTRRVALPDPCQYIDLGGVAKGFALDLAAESLRETGVERALLHGGTSTIVAIGGPWRIGLPFGDPPGARVTLENLALSVSSQHGDRPGHVLDPRTGKIADGAHAAACLARSAEQTDAWATALVVLGCLPESAPPGLTAVLGSADRGTLPSEQRWTVEGPHAGAVAIGSTHGADR